VSIRDRFEEPKGGWVRSARPNLFARTWAQCRACSAAEVEENDGDMARSIPVPTQRTQNKFLPVASPPHAHRAIAVESPKPMSTPSYRLRSMHLPMLSTRA
jgi:hypothetical protein